MKCNMKTMTIAGVAMVAMLAAAYAVWRRSVRLYWGLALISCSYYARCRCG